MTNQNPQFIQSPFSDLLYYHSFNPYMWDYDAADIQAWQMFRNSEIFAPSIPTMTPDGSFNTPIKNVQQVNGIILTTTQNGNGLDIVFANPTLSTFRVGQKVNDFNMYEAQVVSAAPGKITIMPLNNPSVLTQGTYFKNNTNITAVGMIAASFNSVGTTSIYDTKQVQTDWTEITRETIQIARREKRNLYQSTTPEGEDIFYGYYQNEKDTFNRFLWQTVYKYWFGMGGAGLNLPSGTASKTMGIRNRIIQDSANYISGGAPIDQATFESMIEQAVAVNPASTGNQHLKLFVGIRAGRQISTFYPSQTAFAAASKAGNDAKTVNIALQTGEIYVSGVKVEVIINFGMLNSAKIPDWNKDSVYLLNMAPTVMNDRPAKMVQLIHSSDDTNSTSTVLRKETPGMTGSGAGDSTGMGKIGQNEVTSSPVDGTTIEFLDDSGIAMVGKGHGLYEYIH